MIRRNNTTKNHRKLYVIIAIVIVILVVGVLSWLYWHDNNGSGKVTVIKTTNNKQTVKSQNIKANPYVPTSTSDKTSSSGGVSASSTDSSPILVPSGSFVSNHSPNLSGSPAPSSEESVCNGTPGASCYIQFIAADGTVFQLPTQTLDTSGTAYWSWDVKDNNLEQGNWRITAISTLGSQSKSAQDTRDLTVSQ